MNGNRKEQVTTLTRKEMHETARERISIISKEFTQGFAFLERFPRSVTFFGSARFDENDPYYKQARELAGRIVRELDYAIITGGGPGIMEAANRGAYENNGKSVGLTIQLPHEQVINNYINYHLDFYYFFSRKVCLSFAAEAYIFFPGGFGTLDEIFEILTLVQTKKIERVPIILVGKDFWRDVDLIIRDTLLTEETIDPTDPHLYTITDDLDEVISIIKKTPVKNGIPLPEEVREKALSDKHCVPCEGGVDPFDEKEVKEYLGHVDHWELIEDTHIEKTFVFNTFIEALSFMNQVGQIAEREGHHPDMSLKDYKHVIISLTTHAIAGLSENDFILASKIDELAKKSR
jgi:uncharacterized protein (TIGR00730 family)